jgi:hypothetical protein
MTATHRHFVFTVTAAWKGSDRLRLHGLPEYHVVLRHLW